MSEEKKQETSAPVEVKEQPKEEIKAEQKLFTQEQLDNIIQARIMSERKKYEKKIEEEEKQKTELLKQKQIEEAKSKSEIEKLMKERIAEKDTEILRYKNEIKKERIDNSIMAVASQNNAVSPSQVVALVKDQIRLTDDNRVEILDNNSNVRYNPKGELLSVEEKVKEFLDANPHFRKGSLSGSGSQSAVEGKTVKPFNIQDLDLSKPEDRAKYAEYRKKRDAGAIEINLNK